MSLTFGALLVSLTCLSNAVPLDMGKVSDVTTVHEGDIVMDNIQYSHLLPHASSLTKRASFRRHWYLWTSKVIPYEIVPDMPSKTIDLIKRALTDYQNKTCLTFSPRTREKNWIRFTRQKGCWSNVGRQSSDAQNISIGTGCDSVGVIQHEVMHALGFFHEQSRPDRDFFVSIFWENILPGQEKNFVRYSSKAVSTLGLEYDYESVMHYGNKYFSKNGKATVRATVHPGIVLGQRYGLSKLDYAKVNVLYDCSFHQLDSWSQWSLYSPCDGNCVKTRQRFCYSEHPGHCNGASRKGIQTQTSDCSHKECYAPVDGHWGRWSRFTACSASCGIGMHRRVRLCNDPSPAYGGKDCVGKSTESNPCRLRFCDKGPYDCDCTDNICNWKQSKSDDFDWTRKSEGTPSVNTGPDWDHTGLVPGIEESRGYFLYIEATAKRRGYRARLISPVFHESGNGIKCLSFFYHMFGFRMGKLNIYFVLRNGLQVLLWRRSGDQGRKWHHGTVSFVSFLPHTIEFEGVRGSGFTSDIAIDDITVVNHNCKVELNPTSSVLTRGGSTGTSTSSILLSNMFSNSPHMSTTSISEFATVMNFPAIPVSVSPPSVTNESFFSSVNQDTVSSNTISGKTSVVRQAAKKSNGKPMSTHSQIFQTASILAGPSHTVYSAVSSSSQTATILYKPIPTRTLLKQKISPTQTSNPSVVPTFKIHPSSMSDTMVGKNFQSSVHITRPHLFSRTTAIYLPEIQDLSTRGQTFTESRSSTNWELSGSGLAALEDELNCGSGLLCESTADVSDDKLDLGRVKSPQRRNAIDFIETLPLVRGNCDFRSGFCDWTQGDADGTLGWSEGQQITEWHLFRDSNSGIGKFIFVDATKEKYKTIATLTSPLLQTHDRGVCFKLAVKFTGPRKKFIKVYVVDEDKRVLQTMVNSEKGAGNWKEYSMLVYPAVRYRVVIRGEFENGPQAGTIGIQYIKFVQGWCGEPMNNSNEPE